MTTVPIPEDFYIVGSLGTIKSLICAILETIIIVDIIKIVKKVKNRKNG